MSDLKEDSFHDLLVRGIAAVKAGEPDEAKRYLERLLDQDPPDELRIDALWYLSEIGGDNNEKRRYVEDILAIDPLEGRARRKLALLNGTLKSADVIDPDKIKPSSKENAAAHTERYTCPQCGGRMTFSPDGQTLICESCESRKQLLTGQPKVDATQDFFLAMATEKGHLVRQMGLVFHCEGCGSEFLLPASQLTLTCPFCNSNYVVKCDDLKSILNPNEVIPFKLDLEAARKALEKWFKEHPAKKGVQHSGGLGMYLPVWSFSISGRLPWRGKYKQDRKFIPINGEDFILFDHLLVPASRNQPKGWRNFIKNYPMSEAIPFSQDFLASWAAQTYEIELAEGSLDARQMALQKGRDQITQGGDREIYELIIDSSAMMVDGFTLCLLPVWVLHYKTNEQEYTLLINGYSGEINDERINKNILSSLGEILGIR